ncbi:CHASE2 domain-containing protein [Geobacter sp. SVR]|uniref:CHASE2 domain-containing protein n=1 Tax=Geobacter sp. SVR TaxID=2495594 RepID=UPI00143EFBBD|nr:CHASE2 domain-containing protein [Geobacter sp. SVR]BCS52869.1 hypothetical protein GSVR_11770 [Geobacter sp. SVR]GCF87492.1 hypothetical protein GSbR_40920 [Geobacter sp. SVR]
MRKLRFFILLAVLIAVVPCLEFLGALSGVDTYLYDTFLRLRGERSVSQRIVIVAIDAASLDALGRWPLPRRYYAEMLERLDQAAVVGFDLLLMEPDKDDILLGEAIRKHGRVILAEYLEGASTILEPLAGLSPLRTGHIHVEPGTDHVTRGMFHSIYCNGRLLPSLTSVINETVFRRQFRRTLPQDTVSGAPIQQRDFCKINFYGPPGSFNQVSLADVVRGGVPPSYFRDKIVLVGVTVPGVVDGISTPFSQSRTRMSGVEVHAAILNNLMENSMISDLPGWCWTGALIASSLGLALVFLRLSERNTLLAWCASQFLVLAGAFLLLTFSNRWLPPAAFLVSFTMVFAMVYLYRLDRAVCRLDREYEIMTSLLGRNAGESDDQGRPRGIFGFISLGGVNEKIRRQARMTSRLLRLHRQLEIALKNEREALDNQIRFVEMLSHEYRTPLAIIRANLDILEMRDNDPGERFSAYYAKMKRAISRLVEVMDTSLGRERMEETTAAMKREEIGLMDFLQGLLDEARGLWTERCLQLELENGGGGCRVQADGALLKTALLNLIDNAIKYSPGSTPVRVVLGISGATAVVSVHNSGAVIAPADLERVFEKYYRGRDSANTQGAGLGLYLVRKIVEQLGGTVILSSSAPTGTCATVRIPLS